MRAQLLLILALSWLLYHVVEARAAGQTTPAAVNGGVYHAAAPTLSDGQNYVFSFDVNGNLKTVNGGSTSGNQSNAGSGVATSSTNVPTVSYDYGFNGTTWDQLQVDANKFLKVDVAAGTVTALAVETNPNSTLTRPANTTGYTTGQLIASSTTAGSVVVPSYAATTVGGGNSLSRRWRLTTNATTGWGATLTVNLWSAAPTYTNGDGGAYAVATGGAGFLASCSITLTQWGDTASGVCAPAVGSDLGFVGTNIFWDLQTTGAATPISGQTFKLTAEVLDNQ